MDDKILTNALEAIKQLVIPGYALLGDVTDHIFWWAAGFAVLFAMIAWLLRPSADPAQFVSPWIAMLFGMFFVAIMMKDFLAWSTAWVNFTSSTGVYAGGGGGPMHGLEDISEVVENGWNASAAVWRALNSFSIYFQTGSFLMLACCVALILISHCILAFRLFKLFGEFYILSVITFLVTPFAVWRMTLFLAEGPAKYIISTGISIAAIGFGYSLVHRLVGLIVYDPAMQAGTYFGQAFAMFALLTIVGNLPSGIRSMITGRANTNMGGEAHQMAWTATAAASAARMALAMAPAAGAATGVGTGGGSNLPGGITFNPNFSPGGSSTGSGGGATGILASSANVQRGP